MNQTICEKPKKKETKLNKLKQKGNDEIKMAIAALHFFNP